MIGAGARIPQGLAGPGNHWVFLAIFAGSLLLRLPFRAQFLVNWDAANFALATRAFDIQHHQPHPPGYIGYVALGHVLNYITGDPHASLTLLSAVAGALASGFFFLLASQFMRRRYAVATAVLFALSPVVWYYSQVALSYSVELALALAMLWTGYRARSEHSVRYLLAATVLLALLGAVRQSGAVFLLPLWLYIAWAFPWPVRFRGLAVLVIGNLAWLVPLLWLAGGPLAYLRESASLAGAVVTPVSVFSLNLWGLMRNVTFVVGGFLAGVNIGFVAIALAYRWRLDPAARLLRHDRFFFFLWVVPALLVYLLVHTGQLGYVLLILPIGFLWVGTALASVFEQRRRRQPRPANGRGLLAQWAAPGGLLALLALVNVFAFFFLPTAAYTLAHANDAEVIQRLTISASGDNEQGSAARARQYDLKRNDAHWNDLLDLVHGYRPDTTVLLTVPDGAGSYRQLTYYLSDQYRVYGLGKDQDGDFGHLFTSKDGANDYTIEGLRHARKMLTLPSKVWRVIIPDAGIYERFDRSLPQHRVTLDSGATTVIALVPPGTTLVFENFGEDGYWISHVATASLDFPLEY